jgi:hypothetical protein
MRTSSELESAAEIAVAPLLAVMTEAKRVAWRSLAGEYMGDMRGDVAAAERTLTGMVDMKASMMGMSSCRPNGCVSVANDYKANEVELQSCGLCTQISLL